jgi:hypothetical protein
MRGARHVALTCPGNRRSQPLKALRHALTRAVSGGDIGSRRAAAGFDDATRGRTRGASCGGVEAFSLTVIQRTPLAAPSDHGLI